MKTATLLPNEALSNILRLSIEDLDPQKQQRTCFIFGQVSRAFYLSSDLTSFYVGSEAQAKALMAKLFREKKWSAQQEGSARKTRATPLGMRVSRVRKLVARLSKKETGGGVLGKLLLACKDVITLDVDLGGELLKVSATLPALEAALGGLAALRNVKMIGRYPSPNAVLRLLTVILPSLESLDLEEISCSKVQIDQNLLRNISGPRLRRFRAYIPRLVDLFGFLTPSASAVAKALAAYGNLRELHLKAEGNDGIIALVESLLPIAPHLHQFTWNSASSQIPWSHDGFTVLGAFNVGVEILGMGLSAWPNRLRPLRHARNTPKPSHFEASQKQKELRQV
ncbi:hypothetical protein P7C70_g4216, partial [Phenoliferia sp. Uapishka_3]